MTYYVGSVGPGRHAAGVVFGPMTRERWIAQGGRPDDWDRAIAAGYVYDPALSLSGYWRYAGAPECMPEADTSDGRMLLKVEGVEYENDDALRAMARCNRKAASGASGGGEGDGCCCGKKKGGATGKGSAPSGGTPGPVRGTVDPRDWYEWSAPPGSGATAATTESGDGGHDDCCCCCCPPDGGQPPAPVQHPGTIASEQINVAGFGGYADGAHPVTMIPLGPWNQERGAIRSQGGTTALPAEGHGEDCGCCCCCPCDPAGYAYTQGIVITSDPVASYVKSSGLAIQSGQGQMQTRSAYREGLATSQPRQQPLHTVAVPGSSGPVASVTQAQSSQKNGDCGCGCGGACGKGGTKAQPEPSPTPKDILPPEDLALPSAMVLPQPMRDNSSVFTAGAVDAEAFASFSRDLLADVLTVQQAASARVAPASETDIASQPRIPARAETLALRRTISG